MPAGRPSKYQNRFIEDLINFFDVDPYEQVDIEHYGKNGDVKWIDKKMMPVKLPSLVDFAKSINVGVRTVYDWIDPEHASYKKKFSQTYKHVAKKLQKWCLIQGGLTGAYNPLFAKFVGANIAGMSDKQEHEHNLGKETVEFIMDLGKSK